MSLEIEHLPSNFFPSIRIFHLLHRLQHIIADPLAYDTISLIILVIADELSLPLCSGPGLSTRTARYQSQIFADFSPGFNI